MADRFTVTDTFIQAQSPLKPMTAVAAIPINEKHEVLLQLRDDIEPIFFPNHWGCFGGAIEKGETPMQALHRELEEEMALQFNEDAIAPFITISFNPRPGGDNIDRYFFVVEVSSQAAGALVVGEGQEAKFFSFEEAMRLPNTSPYDRFGLWLYYNQHRITD